MSNLFWLSSLVLLLILWLIYRETRHWQKKQAWQKEHPDKNIHNYQKIKRQQKKVQNLDHLRQSQYFIGSENSLNSLMPKELEKFKLIQPGMLNEETLACAGQIIDCIKRPHPALQELTRNTTPEKLIDVLHGCPDITAKILTTVNSAAFGVSQPITSINHAVIYLGINLVKSIATNFIIKQSLLDKDKTQQHIYHRLWSTAYLTSSLSFLMAQSLAKINAAELSTKALLNSIGQLAIVSYDNSFSEIYSHEASLVQRIKAEQRKYGLNASIIGSLLAKKWKLPNDIIENITYSYFPINYLSIPAELVEEVKHDVIFCYFMCRIGEEILYNDLQNIEAIELDKKNNSEFFYLQQALEEHSLSACLTVLKDKQFIDKANQLIKQAQK